MERVLVFLPSVLVIAGIAAAIFIYLKWIIKRFGDDFKSVEWHKQNQWKVIWSVGTPLTNVWAPTIEELVFRAPIIIAFSAMSSFAWYGVLTSSILFSLAHWFGKKIWMPEILSERENGDHKSDDVVEEVDRLHQEAGNRILMTRIAHVVLTLPLGILAGYYGIKYQSIWVSVGIHSVWNLVMPTVVPLLILVVMLGFLALSSLWDKVRWSKRW
jgi:membrane protease YdiL (CAAX protease family)